jgi:nitrogen regulatory protein PII-like uncharacterized protein
MALLYRAKILYRSSESVGDWSYTTFDEKDMLKKVKTIKARLKREKYTILYSAITRVGEHR